MTVCYPLAFQQDYTELKYSLRSLKFLKDISEVVIVGSVMPQWLTGVTQIELADVPNKPQLSVRRKIVTALEYAGEIFMMMDDIYLLRETDPKNFPYYSTGLLSKIGESGAIPLTKQLLSMGKPIRYYGHYPALYRNDFKDVLSRFTNECITKSCYLNFTEVESVEVPDCKLLKSTKPEVIKEFIKNKPCFSTGIFSLKSALPVLEELYSEPSIYEI